MAETTPTVTPLEGKTTVDDKMFFEPERLSYESADRIAETIASEIGDVKDRVVVITGTSLLVDLANLESSYLELDNLAKAYESITALGSGAVERRKLKAVEHEALAKDLVAEVISGAIAPATTLINAAVGLAALFRVDVEYLGAKTTLDALAFEIAIAARVKAKKASKVIVPELAVLNVAKSEKGSVRARLEEVQTMRTRAWAAMGPLISELVRLEAKLNQAALEKHQDLFNQLSQEVSDLRRDLQPVSDPVSRCDQRLADIQDRLSKTDDSGRSLMARMLRAEAIKAKDPIYLHAAVVSSGGHYRISRSLFRMIFLGDGLSFTGGAIVRWALLASDGSVEKGGILVERISGTAQAA